MKNIKVAILVLFAGGVLSGEAQESEKKEQVTTIKTKNGRVYQDVAIIRSDEDGILFRHRDGVTKESFRFLSEELRDRYQKVGKIPPPPIADVDRDDDEGVKVSTVTLRVRQQVYLPNKANCGYQKHCYLHPNPANWPSHWPKFRYAHYLTNPVCRELATRDFLYTTGLLPLPNGVRVYRFPGPTPWPFR